MSLTEFMTLLGTPPILWYDEDGAALHWWLFRLANERVALLHIPHRGYKLRRDVDDDIVHRLLGACPPAHDDSSKAWSVWNDPKTKSCL